jgi:hypothetical protein
MRRGEVWWAEFDERRPVVLLSGEDPSGFRAMQVVAPADTDISGLGIELSEIKDSVRRRTQADGEGTDAHTSEGRSRPDDQRSVAAQQQDHDLRLEY